MKKIEKVGDVWERSVPFFLLKGVFCVCSYFSFPFLVVAWMYALFECLIGKSARLPPHLLDRQHDVFLL